jgi:hypothetical protein
MNRMRLHVYFLTSFAAKWQSRKEARGIDDNWYWLSNEGRI